MEASAESNQSGTSAGKPADTEIKTLSLEEALDLNPMGLFQYRLLLMCGFAFMADALEVNLLTFLATCAGDQWGLSDAQKASITGIVFAGIILGTMFWGMFADRYGRRITYFCACAMITFGGVLSGASPGYEWLILFRALAGFGIGGASVPFDLLAEFIASSHRGRFLIYIEYFWTLGSMFVAGLAWGTLDSQGWRFLAYMTAVPVTLVSAVSIVYLPESPRWLLIKGRREEAEEVVRAAAAVNGVDMGRFTLMHDSSNDHIADATYLELLKDKEARRTSYPLWIIWAIFGFTYYGFILFLGRVYSVSDDDSSCSFDYSAIFINAASEVAGCTVGAIVIDRWGRVISQSAFYAIGGVAVFLMGFDINPGLLLFCSIVGRMSALVASSATWVTTPELYSTEMRTVGHSTCVAASKVAAFLSPFLVSSPASSVAVGLVLGVLNIVGAVACNFLPETKGMSLDAKDELRSSLLSNEADTTEQLENAPRDGSVSNILHGEEVRTSSGEGKPKVELQYSPKSSFDQ